MQLIRIAKCICIMILCKLLVCLQFGGNKLFCSIILIIKTCCTHFNKLLFNSSNEYTCVNIFFPRTLTRPQNLCLNPFWKESHSSVSAACFSLAEVSNTPQPPGSCSERANQKLQVHFITAHCVCAWRRHVPTISETISHQHYCMLSNLWICVAAPPYRHCSRSSLCKETSAQVYHADTFR